MEAFEVEVVELLFPELYAEIAWEKGTESLDMELKEIQKDIFDKDSAEKIISDKIIKVRLKDNGSKILFIHVEVQSYSSEENTFGERMFRYFYRIWDKFRYKYDDDSEIVAAAIYTYKGHRGKDTKYIYSLPELEGDILVYNFRTIDEDILKAKIKLAEELYDYDKVKNEEQIKALVWFLEYLFLIQDEEYEKKFEEFKNEKGGVINMTVDQIREKYCEEKGERKKAIEIAKEMLKDGEPIEKIIKYSKLTKDEIEKLK